MPDEVVYVLGTPSSNTVKIGRTTNVARRIADIQRMSPVPLSVLWSHPGGHELETWLHRHFADRRSHGEWFTFEDDPLPVVQEAVAEYLRPAPEPASPPPGLSSADLQKWCDLLDEVSALHIAKRAELEEAIAEARLAGASLTEIAKRTPFSREWVRRIADRVERERATA